MLFENNIFEAIPLPSKQEKLLLALVATKINLNPARLQQILQIYQGNLLAGVKNNFGLLREKKLKWLDKWPLSWDFQASLDKFELELERESIGLVTCLEDIYPEELRILSDYPVVLYFQGNWDLLQNKQNLTVVGSRLNTHYGKQLLEKILAPVCSLGVGVISGLAAGIDALAHQTALEHGAKTVAVIGSGLSPGVFYPKQNLSLRRQILEKKGLILSEYAPTTGATTFTFPQRNRILAALSDLTWVVQAGQKSGSLITALKARDLGKTVATTPNSIFEENFSGNLQLLKDGASIILEPEDILMLMGLKIHPEIQIQTAVQFGSKEEEKIYSLLNLSPQNVESLSQKMAMSVIELSTHLSMLELSGLATHLGENEWVRG